MNITFIQDPQHNINSKERRQDQDRLIAQGGLESLGQVLTGAARSYWQGNSTELRVDGGPAITRTFAGRFRSVLPNPRGGKIFKASRSCILPEGYGAAKLRPDEAARAKGGASTRVGIPS